MKNIVVLGGGYAGVLTAKKLAKRLKKDPGINITLIDQNPFHTMLTELHEVAAGRVEGDSIRISFKRIFAGRKVDVITDKILQIDKKSNTLKGEKQSYLYDYLVVCSGSKPTFFGVEGAKENTFLLWSYDDAVKIHEHIKSQFFKATKETDGEKRREMLTFIVVGAGFTGVEMMGELAEWLPVLCDKYEVDKKETKLYIVDILDRVVPTLPEKLSVKAQKRLEKMDVEVLLKTEVTSIDAGFLCCKEGEKEKIYKTGTVIWSAGVEGQNVVSDSPGLPIAGRGRISTTQYLNLPENEEIFVAGDNLFFVPENEKAPVPQMVENAEESAEVVAHNITALLKSGEKKTYKPVFHGVMVCIGGRYGLANVGTAKRKFALPSFLAMFVKHFINMVYFIQILGWNKVFNYIVHEFFNIPDRRSFVGGHFAKNTLSFFLVPLRLFLGISWVLEGWPKLVRIINDPGKVFLFTFKTQDAISSATAPQIKALPVPHFIAAMVDFVMNNIIIYIAAFAQGTMVTAEILIGLALMGGLFTAPAAVVSCLMCVMIYVSGTAEYSILWFFFCGIAMISSSGSTFGADYYVLPWLKKRWKKLKFVQKWYFYND